MLLNAIGEKSSDPISRKTRAALTLNKTAAAMATISSPATIEVVLKVADAPPCGGAADNLNGDGSGSAISLPTQTSIAYFAGTLEGVTRMPKSPDVLNFASQRPAGSVAPRR